MRQAWPAQQSSHQPFHLDAALRTSTKTVLSSPAMNRSALGEIGHAQPSRELEARTQLSCPVSQHERCGRLRGLADLTEEWASASLFLFLRLERFATAFNSARGCSTARIRTALLALLDHLELEPALNTGVHLPQFHLMTVGHHASTSTSDTTRSSVISSYTKMTHLKPASRSVSGTSGQLTVARANWNVSSRNHGAWTIPSGDSPKGAS